MFKKLKQKLEEGGEGGLERVSFSEKLPGSIVRTTALNNGGPQSSSSNRPLSGNQNSALVLESTYSEDALDNPSMELLQPPGDLSSSLGYSQPSSDSENVACEDHRWNTVGETVGETVSVSLH